MRPHPKVLNIIATTTSGNVGARAMARNPMLMIRTQDRERNRSAFWGWTRHFVRKSQVRRGQRARFRTRIKPERMDIRTVALASDIW